MCLRVCLHAHTHFVSSALLHAAALLEDPCTQSSSLYKNTLYCLNSPSPLAELYNTIHMFACEPPSIALHGITLHCVHAHRQSHPLRHGGGIPVRPGGLGNEECWNFSSKTTARFGFVSSYFHSPSSSMHLLLVITPHPHLLSSPLGSRAWAFQTSIQEVEHWKNSFRVEALLTGSPHGPDISPQCKSCLCFTETTKRSKGILEDPENVKKTLVCTHIIWVVVNPIIRSSSSWLKYVFLSVVFFWDLYKWLWLGEGLFNIHFSLYWFQYF